MTPDIDPPHLSSEPDEWPDIEVRVPPPLLRIEPGEYQAYSARLRKFSAYRRENLRLDFEIYKGEMTNGIELGRVRLEHAAGGIPDFKHIDWTDEVPTVGEGTVGREMIDHPELAGAQRRRQAGIERRVDPEAAGGGKDLLHTDVLEEMDRRDVPRQLQRLTQRDGAQLLQIPVMHRVAREGMRPVAVIER